MTFFVVRYDDYGRVKKKYRNMIDKKTREEAALARLRGSYDPSPSGQVFVFDAVRSSLR